MSLVFLKKDKMEGWRGLSIKLPLTWCLILMVSYLYQHTLLSNTYSSSTSYFLQCSASLRAMTFIVLPPDLNKAIYTLKNIRIEKGKIMTSKAVVVSSGGQDSTTCLVQALKKYDEVHAITFDYGQRHKLEIEVAEKLCKQLGVKAHKVMDVGLLNELAISSRTSDDIPVSHELQENGLPNSFVPGRNILFFNPRRYLRLSDWC